MKLTSSSSSSLLAAAPITTCTTTTTKKSQKGKRVEKKPKKEKTLYLVYTYLVDRLNEMTLILRLKIDALWNTCIASKYVARPHRILRYMNMSTSYKFVRLNFRYYADFVIKESIPIFLRPAYIYWESIIYPRYLNPEVIFSPALAHSFPGSTFN